MPKALVDLALHLVGWVAFVSEILGLRKTEGGILCYFTIAANIAFFRLRCHPVYTEIAWRPESLH